MKTINFSCKHDILLRGEDGTLIPMDEPYFLAREIAPNTWQIRSDGDYTYLVAGDYEALVIDSGYGCGNIREYCQSLTDKPVRRIANTHHHFDHTANNCYFDCAYMSEETKKLATIPFPSFEGIEFPKDYPIEVIGEGYKFKLGNRELETFEMPDHATGSLVYLDRKERILFSGDEIMLMGKKLNGSVARFVHQLESLEAHRSEFDTLYGGAFIMDGSYIEKYLENARYILKGNEGVLVKPHSFPNKPADTMGREIWDRWMPHPGDLPKNFNEITEFMRTMEYAGVKITYDIRKIQN